MLYVGLDVHSKRSSICILNNDGKIVKEQTIQGRWPEVIDRLAELNEPMSVCYEASCGYGNIHDRLSSMPLAQQISVAHPGELRLIFRSKKKFDRVDARKIAKLLYLDEVPRVHVPGLDVRAWRKLIEFRQRILRQRVACKNQIRAIVRAQGLAAPRGLWGKKGVAWLKELNLAAAEKLTLEMTLEELNEKNQQIKRIEKELASIAGRHPGVALLMTIPGVGIRTAEAFCAYVDDIKRFARSKQVGTYFGLVPCLDSSAGRDRLGHITGDGPPTVRKMLSEAAWMAIRHNATLKEFFQRVMRNDPDRKKIALVATAHRLCVIMAAMLRTGEAWRESESAQDSPQAPEQHATEEKKKEQKDGGVPPAAVGAPPRKTPDA